MVSQGWKPHEGVTTLCYLDLWQVGSAVLLKTVISERVSEFLRKKTLSLWRDFNFNCIKFHYKENLQQKGHLSPVNSTEEQAVWYKTKVFRKSVKWSTSCHNACSCDKVPVGMFKRRFFKKWPGEENKLSKKSIRIKLHFANKHLLKLGLLESCALYRSTKRLFGDSNRRDVFPHIQDVFLEKTVIAAVKHVGGDVEVWCYVSALRSGQLGVTDLNVNSAAL